MAYQQVIDDFMKIFGVGRTKAEGYYAIGCRSYEDLIACNVLSRQSVSSIPYISDISEKIPRSEMDQWFELFNKVFGSNQSKVKWDMAGSYRRKLPFSGDIDLIFSKLNNASMDWILSKISDFELVELSRGKTKYMGIVRLDESSKARRLDITLVDDEFYGSTLLHATGSAKFAIKIRRKAQSLGFTLSEYGLRRYGEKITAKTEQDIFEQLGMDFVNPEDR